jgi:hypothetical protein
MSILTFTLTSIKMSALPTLSQTQTHPPCTTCGIGHNIYVEPHSFCYIKPIDTIRDEENEALICPLSLEPIYSGVQLPCGHIFEKELLDNVICTSINIYTFLCPLCRDTFRNDVINPLPPNIQARLDLLEVKCPNTEYGCLSKSIPRFQLPSHLEKECMFYPTNCTKCKTSMLRKDLETHLCHYKCPNSQYGCETSTLFTTNESLSEHIQNECFGAYTRCPHCNDNYLRKLLQNHVDNDCSFTSIECVNGCGLEIQRYNQRNHNHDCNVSMNYKINKIIGF